ncbi:MAG: lysine transporter LysE, partial [Thermoprotei archaeon]
MSLIELIEALVFIVVLSMSGVLIPGPMTLAVISHAVAKGAMAGVLVVLGHALIEIPLIILIYMGLISTIGIEQVNPIVAIIGGVSFLLMSISALKYVLKGSFELKALKVSSTSTFMAGIITTAFNPSFILWWPTTGLFLV